MFSSDPCSGLKLIIAIFSTTRGPALGGLRFWPYRTERCALADVLRLAKGMAYKAAIAGLPFGGGKAVVIHERGQVKSERLLHAIGAAIDRLGGRYITGEDVGSTVDDMAMIRDKTAHVLGTPVASGGSGDPSPSTALGCYYGIRACVKHVFGVDSLDSIRVAVQGAGNVGSQLCRLLAADGAKLYLCDLDSKKAKVLASRLNAEVVDHHAIYDLDADVFSPCALGSVLNSTTVQRLRVPIVAGGANNQLASDSIGTLLYERGILYAPDYVINSGGLIQLATERTAAKSGCRYEEKAVARQVARVHDVLLDVFRRADSDGVPSFLAADRIAEEQLRIKNSEPVVFSGSP